MKLRMLERFTIGYNDRMTMNLDNIDSPSKALSRTPTSTGIVVLVAILLLAVLIRLPYVSIVGHSDLNYFYDRAVAIEQHGLLAIYAQDEGKDFNYPPIYFFALAAFDAIWSAPDTGTQAGIDPVFLLWHKLFQIAVDLVLIAVVYWWLPRKGRLYWLIPLALALYPALIVTSAFWGQIDTLWTGLLVLAFIALNRDQPTAAWVWFALAVLTKFQAVLVFPLIFTLTVRRYHLRSLLVGGAAAGIVTLAVLLPFILVSGLERTLRPFTVAVDFFPSTTIWALNLWYVINPMVWGARPPLLYDNVSDADMLLGVFTYKQVGLVMLGLYTLLICVSVWRSGAGRREFVWAAALCFGFFMLPTQMHERYFHPAAVFLLLAVAQDRRLWPVALGAMLAYSYNVIVPTHQPFNWLGINILFLLGDISLHIALLNLLLFAWLTGIAVSPRNAELRARLRPILRGVGAAVAAVLLLAIGLRVMLPDRLPPDAQSLNARFGDSIWLQGYNLKQGENTWTVDLYWRATTHHNESYSVFVHALRDGATIAQCDGLPQGGAYPTWRWFHNRLVQTTCQLTLPEGAPPDMLAAGLYDPTTVVNLPVVQNGIAIPDGRAVIDPP